ncbi:MAG: hypothetical protein M2R45_00198 [Verrucomicrobia subdivision 3 bacterium]|nr:hypothetical protein [Limisphaerales bacterium]MCS1412343.1 hypothetical protein [Limisphaerales bacterium]
MDQPRREMLLSLQTVFRSDRFHDYARQSTKVSNVSFPVDR